MWLPRTALFIDMATALSWQDTQKHLTLMDAMGESIGKNARTSGPKSSFVEISEYGNTEF